MNSRDDDPMARWVGLGLSWLAAGLVTGGFLLFLSASVGHARDNGQYAQSNLKSWFDQLKSRKGSLCCTNADGRVVVESDWDTEGGHYRVRLDGMWLVVPDNAVVIEPNRAGTAIVWPYMDGLTVKIRCFIPGALT